MPVSLRNYKPGKLTWKLQTLKEIFMELVTHDEICKQSLGRLFLFCHGLQPT